MKGHIYLWQEISSYDKKYLPATRNFFVWQEINAFDKRFLPMTINFFLWKLITCSAKKFLPVTKNISCMLCVIRRISSFDRKYRPLSQICAKTTWNADKISCESEDFVGAWLPGSRLISRPEAFPDKWVSFKVEGTFIKKLVLVLLETITDTRCYTDTTRRSLCTCIIIFWNNDSFNDTGNNDWYQMLYWYWYQ